MTLFDCINAPRQQNPSNKIPNISRKSLYLLFAHQNPQKLQERIKQQHPNVLVSLQQQARRNDKMFVVWYSGDKRVFWMNKNKSVNLWRKKSRKIEETSENFEKNTKICFEKFLIFWVFLGNFPSFSSIFPALKKKKRKFFFWKFVESGRKSRKILEKYLQGGEFREETLGIFAEFCDATEYFWWIF